MPTNIISKVQVPDGSVYKVKPAADANVNIDGVFCVDLSGTEYNLTGTLDVSISSYYNGLKILAYNTLSSEIVSNATVNINSLGAVQIKRYDTVGDTIKPHSYALLVYRNGYFYLDNYKNTVNEQVTGDNPVRIAGRAMTATENNPLIVFLGSDGKIYDAQGYLNNLPSGLHINPDFGLALLIHTVSANEQIKPEYLVRKGIYPYSFSNNEIFSPYTVDASIIGQPVYVLFTHDAFDIRTGASTHQGGYGPYEGDSLEILPYHIIGLTPFQNKPAISTFKSVYWSSEFQTMMGPTSYYMGTVISNSLISVDFSNVSFNTYDSDLAYFQNRPQSSLGARDARYLNLTHINGQPVYNAASQSQADIEFLHSNPVSGTITDVSTDALLVGESSIYLGEFVYMSTIDKRLYGFGSQLVERYPIDLDWGFAVYHGGDKLPGEWVNTNFVLQNTYIHNCTSTFAGDNTHSGPVYVKMKKNREGYFLDIDLESDTESIFTQDMTAPGIYAYAGYFHKNDSSQSYQFAVDFSNHDTYDIDASGNITYINGRAIAGKGGSQTPTTYDNPVAGDAQAPIAGTDIPANTFVILSKQLGSGGSIGKLYPINSSLNMAIDMNWGMAFLTEAVTTGNRPAYNKLKQQCYVTRANAAANIDIDFDNNDGSCCYIHCSENTNKTAILSNRSTLSYEEANTKLNTLIYVGYIDYNGNISIDLSDHDFRKFDLSLRYVGENSYSFAGAFPPETSLSKTSAQLASDVSLGTGITKLLTVQLESGYWFVTAQLSLHDSSTTKPGNATLAICSSTGNLSSAANFNTAIKHTATLTTVINTTSGGYTNVNLQCFINNTAGNLYVYLIGLNNVANIVKVRAAPYSSYPGTNLLAVRIGPYVVN